MDTKSTDKRMSLLHYIVATIRVNFPELMNFDTELLYIDKAAQGKWKILSILCLRIFYGKDLFFNMFNQLINFS